ncbi:MAG: hypothetical protein PW789_16170 [Edaphobacter sp.]|uniref:hypothetical protein n=1 Tax=Edaphobacter sp. TaxID=1934404 RepID=UPI00239926D5|nr:hypothetical protein [Edaphobacter sp.]MDE1178114.1 hypothetical protein [Edaphobacter sp.]
MKKLLSISTMLLAFGARGYGQAAPAATPTGSTTSAADQTPRPWFADGTVHYALSATELFQFGYYGSGNVTTTTAFSGNVGYMTLSQTHPFTLIYSGGVLIGQGGQGTTTYHNVAVSQSLIKGKWIMGITDSFSFLPQSPTTGVSGIAGVGPIGSIPTDPPSLGAAGGVLTYSNNRIGNTVTGTVERLLTGRTSISGAGSYTILHFLDDDAGLDNTSTTGQVSVNHRINVRNSVSVSAVYSSYETTGLYSNLPGYPYNNVTYQTKGINLTYLRQWTRSLSTDVSAGPQWISSSSAALVPDRLNAYVNGGINYVRPMDSFGLRYTHGVNGGSGAFAGAEADSVSATYNHTINRNWAASAWVNYTHTTGLLYVLPDATNGSGAINTEYGTVQVMHGFTRTISGYASYTAQNQDVNTPLASQNVYSGLSHTIGIGVSWAPKSTRLGEF